MEPICFEPEFRRYIWGGRRLGTSLGKSIGAGSDYAESWEIVDRAEVNSRVREGRFAGASLRELLTRFGRELLGERIWKQVNEPGLPESLRGRFPLLLKYLDASQVLSVQVHPDDRQGALLSPPDLGKTEAWYVIEAQPESVIWCGLKKGVGAKELKSAVDNGTTGELLHEIRPRAGDCIFVPAGTVHAIGAGLLIAEVQQCSDTTYRLFDWNRVDSQGQSRPLHIEQALAVTDFSRGPVPIQQPEAVPGQPAEDLIRCDKFCIRRWRPDKERVRIETGGQFHIITVVAGDLRVEHSHGQLQLALGETVLLPAVTGHGDITGSAGTVILDISPGDCPQVLRAD
jgi:mannose-6-phosphate isomerase